MAPKRLLGPTFFVRPDGCVEMPTAAAEIMFILMIYMPDSWNDVVAQLKTLEPFKRNLDVHNLVYSFCMALNAGDSALLDLVTYDGASAKYRLPPAMEASFRGQTNPMEFWAGPDGMALRDLTVDVMSSFRSVFRTPAEYFLSRQNWDKFCFQVNRFSSEARSSIEWVTVRSRQRVTSLTTVFLDAYRPIWRTSREQVVVSATGLGETASRAMARFVLRDIREMRDDVTHPGLMNIALTDAVRRHSRRAFETRRKAHVRETMDYWLVQTPHGAGDTCCICLEDIKFPGVVTSSTTEGSNSEVPVHTPCGHYFGGDCLSEWFLEHETCPLCRQVLVNLTSTERRLLRSSRSSPNPESADMLNLVDPAVMNRLDHAVGTVYAHAALL